MNYSFNQTSSLSLKCHENSYDIQLCYQQMQNPPEKSSVYLLILNIAKYSNVSIVSCPTQLENLLKIYSSSFSLTLFTNRQTNRIENITFAVPRTFAYILSHHMRTLRPEAGISGALLVCYVISW